MKKLLPILGLATFAALAVLAFSAFAQDEVAVECQQACYAAEERCYQACDTTKDLDACETQCAEEAAACLAVCE